ncbi:MAG TPA: hypothetical protein VKV19_16550 [Ktedonobacteraceae bacterium]|jgi:uncharacterized membrane protein YeaQ/YmgE (transglycosylase-associated protein family)|nr:hypothetical protein [Ktedonobacteraceae bacterium]
MPVFYLILTWAVLGIVIGALALAAHFKPATWGKAGWLWMLALGLGSALLGGLLGFWLFDRLFSTATALWVAVLATCVPWLSSNVRARLAKRP